MSMPLIFADGLWRRTLERDGLAPLTYYTGGRGAETVAILNAYGQSLAFWERFIAQLATRYRILIWQPRGTCSFHGGTERAYQMETHVLDMRALFELERVARAHLLGWCTGPKTALAFYAAHPAQVASLVSLTGCFIHNAEFRALYTRYETTILELCRMVAQRPELAPQLAKMFHAGLCRQQSPVPGKPGTEIGTLVQAPFQTPAGIVQYARQLLAFWDHDIEAILGKVAVPALFIGGEADDITHPHLSRETARRVPGAAYAQVREGSHYIHYERPVLLCELVIRFLQHRNQFASGDDAVHIEYFATPQPTSND